MAVHKATVTWERGGADFAPRSYHRDHLWTFEGGEQIHASAAPEFLGNPDCVDPEQAFTAALSSCHMLTFLAVAAARGLTVDRYVDDACGHLGKNERGRMAVVKVVLRPQIEFAGSAPDATTLEQLHVRAHRGCFIANSVSTVVEVQ